MLLLLSLEIVTTVLLSYYRWCDIDLAAFFGPGGADRVRDGWYTLLDPSNSSKEVSHPLQESPVYSGFCLCLCFTHSSDILEC